MNKNSLFLISILLFSFYLRAPLHAHNLATGNEESVTMNSLVGTVEHGDMLKGQDKTTNAGSAFGYMNFNAFQQNRQVDLEWLTDLSGRSAAYIVERSTGADFEAITKITNAEFTAEDIYFKLIDKLPVLGDNHYRLKQVFMDGHIEYSPVSTVSFGIDLDAISFFPNPVESTLFVDLDEYAGQRGHMIISNSLGQTIADIKFEEIPVDLIQLDVSTYTIGMYFIKVKVDKSKYVAKKVLVSKRN